jgi:hypothetical protein
MFNRGSVVIPEDIERRLTAKRNNERVRLTANAMNAVAIAIVGVTIIAPSLNSSFAWDAKHGILVLLAAVLYLGAMAMFAFYRSED